MKFLTIVMITFTLFSCASSNQVSATKVSNDKQVAKNDGLVCKKTRKTGSRMNSTSCITREQQERERRESRDAIKNATNSQQNIVTCASNN
jgi:hypothetical protein